MKDKVIGTNPPANQTSAITNEITVIVGSGPSSKQVPDVAGQTADSAQKNLTVYGFTQVQPGRRRQPAPGRRRHRHQSACGSRSFRSTR